MSARLILDNELGELRAETASQDFTITAGGGISDGNGGSLTFRAGPGSGDGTGGDLNLYAGNSGDAAGNDADGGDVNIEAGSGFTGFNKAGNARIQGGFRFYGNYGSGAGSGGGHALVQGGDSDSYDGGAVYIRGGRSTMWDGGNVLIEGGSGAGYGGGIFITARDGTVGRGGNVEIRAGASNDGEDGRPLVLAAGDADGVTGTGGDVEIQIGAGPSGDGRIRLVRAIATDTPARLGFESSGTSMGHYAHIQAPATLTGDSDYTITLPPDDGAPNEVMITDGSGVLSWASVGSASLSFPLIASPAGTAGAPAYSFTGATSTGVYLAAADTIGLSAGGGGRMSISSTQIQPEIPILTNADGTAAAPAYGWNSDTDQDTGFYRAAEDTIGISTDGTARIEIDTAALTLKHDGAAEFELRFEDGTDGTYVGLKAPDDVDTQTVWALPVADGAASDRQVLATDGAGQLLFNKMGYVYDSQPGSGGGGPATVHAINHGLGQWVTYTMYDTSGNRIGAASSEVASSAGGGTLTITFAVAQNLIVTIMGVPGMAVNT